MTLRLLVLALLALGLAACADRDQPPAGDRLARIQAAKQVRIGVKTDAPPFAVRRGEVYQGFDIDIATEVATRLGADPVLVPVSSGDRSDQVVSGEVDLVVATMTITRYRERRVDFSIPYFEDGQALVVRADSPIRDYQDLAGRTVAAAKGSSSSYYIKQVNPDCTVTLVADTAALLPALRAGTVDAITSDRLLLTGLLHQAGDRAAFRFAGGPFTTEPYGICLPQDQSHLRNAVNHALLAMWEDGTWARIADTWFGPGRPYHHPLTFAMRPWPR